MYLKTILYSIFTFILIYCITKISYKIHLVDIPNKRKTHLKPTAFSGGLALSLVLLFSIQLFDFFDKTFSVIISIGFLIALIGFLDDKYQLNVGGKLSLQVLPILYLIIVENLSLISLGDYIFFELDLGSFKIPFGILSILFLINAFNYFDGLDGTLGFTTISVLLILFFLLKNSNLKFNIIIILIPVIVFLFFNFSTFGLPKLFLGDGGSLYLGFIISFLLIYLANKNITHPILLAWSVVIFVYEFLSINCIRLNKKKNLFLAGTDHLHHLLLGKTKSLFFSNLFISLVNIILFLIGYTAYIMINELFSLILFIIFFIIYLFLRILLSEISK